MQRFVTFLVLIAGLAGGCGAVLAELTVENAYVRGLPPGQKNTAAFFTLINSGDHAITIRAGQSSAAETLEIHAHQHHDGMMAMRLQDSVILPAGERMEFAPGGLHLMLINLTRPLSDGDEVSFGLMLNSEGSEQAQALEISAPVISVLKMNANKPHKHGEH